MILTGQSLDFYDEDIVAKFASLSEFFYEFLEIEYGENFALSETESRRILQTAMGELGHKDLDMDKLSRSYKHYLYEVDLQANPEYDIDCPNFEKILRQIEIAESRVRKSGSDL